MKKQILTLLFFALPLIFITSCSKEEQLIEKETDKEVTKNDLMLSKLAEKGIDVTKKFTPETKTTNAGFLEAYQIYKLEYQDIWYKTYSKFNSGFCAPTGYDYRLNFYIYYAELGEVVFIKNITKHCWDAGEATGLTDWTVSGSYYDIAVIVTAYIVENGQGGGTYYGFTISNEITSACVPGPQSL